MNMEVFNFMSQDVCYLQQLARDSGFVTYSSAEQEAQEAVDDAHHEAQARHNKEAAVAARMM